MIKEDFVSYEVALLLKEKGFNESCNNYYPDSISRMISYRNVKNQLDMFSKKACTTSTLQMAMKWLREVHKISIEITSTGYLIDNDVDWECDIKAGHRLYFKHITNKKTFESCAEAAIKYCLLNLI